MAFLMWPFFSSRKKATLRVIQIHFIHSKRLNFARVSAGILVATHFADSRLASERLQQFK